MSEDLDLVQEQIKKQEEKKQEELMIRLNQLIESGDLTTAIQLMMKNREYFSFEMIEEVRKNINNPEKVKEILGTS